MHRQQRITKGARQRECTTTHSMRDAKSCTVHVCWPALSGSVFFACRFLFEAARLSSQNFICPPPTTTFRGGGDKGNQQPNLNINRATMRAGCSNPEAHTQIVAEDRESRATESTRNQGSGCKRQSGNSGSADEKGPKRPPRDILFCTVPLC